jgi:sporadic carbohydrate cluster protein (TIGR04323 family)
MPNLTGWRGYIFSRPINGQVIPQRVQNLVIRDYAQKQGLLYLLSASEYHMDHCYMMLEATFEELEAIEGVIFYSTHQLPEDDLVRKRIFDRLLKMGRGLRFALEELTVSSQAETTTIEDIIICRQITHHYVESQDSNINSYFDIKSDQRALKTK